MVERPNGSFEDVGAEALDVDNGSLLFFANQRISIAYSPGSWATVTFEYDEGDSK